MPQSPRTGTLDQVLRCLQLLAQTPAFTTEMALVASYMGGQAFTPGALQDANGNRFSLNLIDTSFGDPASWVPMAFQTVLRSEQLRVVGPFPCLQLLGAPGRAMMSSGGGAGGTPYEFDTGEMAGWSYVVDAVVTTTADRPQVAQQTALALMQGFERLVRRNYTLGGLVHLINAEGPPSPGGEVQSSRDALLAGVLLRFRVDTQNSTL